MRRLLAILLLILTVPAEAQLCDDARIPVSADGRVLGHLPYGDAAAGDLVPAPPGVALGACRLRPEAMADLQRLLAAAAADPATQGKLYALSCQRSLAIQRATFCKPRDTDAASDRAISVAPPGHSEHATGYALDFTVRPSDGCPDAEACMAIKPGFKWLTANAPRFGFELSFPPGNAQRVKWEPWHWRWVGLSARTPGAARPRFVFARARRDFPADPAIVDPPVTVATIAFVDPGPPPKYRKPKKRRR